MNVLRQSTAVTIKLGPFIDDSDGKTAETALTISQADVRLSKNGGNYAQKNESSSGTHDELGEYDIDLDTTDTGTVGVLRVMVQESGALPVYRDFQVIEEAVYDALFAASATGKLPATLATADVSGNLPANLLAINSETTPVDNLETACDNYSATRGLSGTALPAAAADAAGGLPISDAGGLDIDTLMGRLDAAITTRMATFTLPTNFSSLLINASGHITRVTTVDTTTANTDMRGTDSAFLASSAPTNFSSLVISGAGAVDSLLQGFLDNTITESTADRIASNFETFYDNADAATTKTVDDVGTASVSGTVDANLIQIEGHALAGTGTQIADGFEHFFDVATPSKTVNDVGVAGSGLSAQDVWEYDISSISTSGQAGSELNDASSGGSLTAAAVADAVWDEATSGHTTAGTFGEQVKTDIDAILVDTGTTIPGVLGSPTAIGQPGSADLADMLLQMAGGATFDVSSESLKQIRSRGDSDWITATGFSTHSAASAASAVQTQLDDDFSTINTHLTDIKGTSFAKDTHSLTDIQVDTNELQSDWANGGRLDLLIDGIKAVTDALPDSGALSSLATSTALATVDTNVDTLISQLTTAVSEPTGAPSNTETVPNMLARLYGALAFKVDVTASTKEYHNSSGTAVWSKAISDDATTYTEAKGS